MKPYQKGFVRVSDGHRLYFERCGNKKGVPETYCYEWARYEISIVALKVNEKDIKTGTPAHCQSCKMRTLVLML